MSGQGTPESDRIKPERLRDRPDRKGAAGCGGRDTAGTGNGRAGGGRNPTGGCAGGACVTGKGPEGRIRMQEMPPAPQGAAVFP